MLLCQRRNILKSGLLYWTLRIDDVERLSTPTRPPVSYEQVLARELKLNQPLNETTRRDSVTPKTESTR